MTIGDRSNSSDFHQWKISISTTARLTGLTPSIRENVWIRLAENYIDENNLNWAKIQQEAFDENILANEEQYTSQIVKDLHRTGSQWSSNDSDRTSLQRVLLGFARYDKSIGYCQGLHILSSVILDVVRGNEDRALMILIYLIHHCLPDYFTNNLNGLAIDVAVFNQWLALFNYPLHKHLTNLRKNAPENEPALVNVFTIQWFLTLYATCLSAEATLRIWDALILDGNEILFRTGLILWSKLSSSIMKVFAVDEFYSLMTHLATQLSTETLFTADDLIKEIYEFGSFPTSILSELREKFNSTAEEKVTKYKDEKGNDPRRNFISCFDVLPSRKRIFNEQTLVDPFSTVRNNNQCVKQRSQQIQIQPWSQPPRPICTNSNETLVNHLLVGSKLVKRQKSKDKSTDASNEKQDQTIDLWIRKSSYQTPKYSSFNPFPSRSFNENVATNGSKLGLYAPVLTTR